VVEKNCEKIHYIAPNIYCCGAGTAADTQFVNLFMSSNLELQRLNSGRQTRVSAYVTSTAKLLYRYEGHLGAHLIAGGYDVLGPHLCLMSGAGKYMFFLFKLLIPTFRNNGFWFAASNHCD
jgi:20S proteasome subunit beta 2